jgi:IS30 family transposase
MIGIAMYTTILTLHKQGISKRQIAKITNTHRKTINKGPVANREIRE